LESQLSARAAKREEDKKKKEADAVEEKTGAEEIQARLDIYTEQVQTDLKQHETPITKDLADLESELKALIMRISHLHSTGTQLVGLRDDYSEHIEGASGNFAKVREMWEKARPSETAPKLPPTRPRPLPPRRTTSSCTRRNI